MLCWRLINRYRDRLQPWRFIALFYELSENFYNFIWNEHNASQKLVKLLNRSKTCYHRKAIFFSFCKCLWPTNFHMSRETPHKLSLSLIISEVSNKEPLDLCSILYVIRVEARRKLSHPRADPMSCVITVFGMGFNGCNVITLCNLYCAYLLSIMQL